MAYTPNWKERLEDAKPYLGPAIAGVVVLALAGWLTWFALGAGKAAKPLTAPPKEASARSAAAARAAAEADVLEKTYQRALESGASEKTAGEMLDRVIAKQRERMQLEPMASTELTEKLARLEATRGSQRSRVAQARSDVLEREARSLRAEGRGTEALEKLREALRLQREANATVGPGGAKDVPRESRLTAEIDQGEAGPLREAVTTALALARSAVAQENWENALKAFGEARKAQAELNERFAATSMADLPGLAKIDREIESLRAAGLAAVTAAREREGDAAARSGRVQEAAASYTAAAAAQREINEKFAQSRYASPARVDDLEVRRQTVLSGILLGRAKILDVEAEAALRRRQGPAAAEKIAAAAKLAEQAAAEFPRSKALDPGLRRKLTYLALRTAEFDALQELVLARLAPVPGGAGAGMFKTEVGQEFYQRVMNANPSRNVGRALPVDSVNWADTQEFCERLAWLLGRKVRLPSEAEFRAAAAGAAAAWTAETSDGHSHEVGKSPANAAGFHDLAGNLAEWLQPATAGDKAPMAAGSFLDPLEALRVPVVIAEEKSARARHVGFRFVVERVAD